MAEVGSFTYPDLIQLIEQCLAPVLGGIVNLKEVDENIKRWMLVGVCLHTCFADVLRMFVEIKLQTLYEFLKKSQKIDKQVFENRLECYRGDGTLKPVYLNYDLINDNHEKYGQSLIKYDYCVRNPVDLAKLFLRASLVSFSAIDDACDISALLEIIISIDVFSSQIRTDAEKVKLIYRHSWYEQKFTKWTYSKYESSFRTMESLIKNLCGLSFSFRKEKIQELNKLEINAMKFFEESCNTEDNITEYADYFLRFQRISKNFDKSNVQTISSTPKIIKENGDYVLFQKETEDHTSHSELYELTKETFDKGWKTHLNELKFHTGLELDKMVLDILISLCVVVIEDREEIEQSATQLQRNNTLINIIMNRPYPTFEIFIDALAESEPNNSDIMDIVRKMRKGQKQNTGSKTVSVVELTDVSSESVQLHKMFNKFVHGIDRITSVAILDYLISKNVINMEEQENIRACKTTHQMNRCLLSIINRKGGNAFQHLMEYNEEDSVLLDITREGIKITDQDKTRIKIGKEAFKERFEGKDQRQKAEFGCEKKAQKTVTDVCTCISTQMREKQRLYIEEWEKDEETFVITRGTNFVMKLIMNQDIVVVVGTSGTGKSSIIHHVALELRKDGYEIIPFVTYPEDILKYSDSSKNQVFVLDDICGKRYMNERSMQSWLDHSERIAKSCQQIKPFKYMKRKIELVHQSLTDKKELRNEMTIDEKEVNTKILVSCRLEVFKDPRFQSLELFTRHVCNLQSEKHKLLPGERRLLLKRYLPNVNTKSLEPILNQYEWFPLLCKVAQEKQNEEKIVQFFSNPVEILEQDIKRILRDKSYKCFVLVICSLFNDGFDEKLIDSDYIETDPFLRQKTKYVTENIGINLAKECDRRNLKDTFAILEDTYIKKKGSKFFISHDKLYDMIALHCAKEYDNLFIKYAPSNFIIEEFKFQKTHDSSICISQDKESSYFDRLLADLKSGDVTSFFNEDQIRNPEYRDKLLVYLKSNIDSCKPIFLNVERRGIVLNQTDEPMDHRPESTLLIEASKVNFYELVKYFIELGFDINKTDNKNKSALFISCENGFLKIVDILISSGADAAGYEGSQHYPIHAACRGEHLEVVSLLIDNKAKLSQYDADAQLPLIIACQKGNLDIVKLILKNQVDVTLRDRNGRSALYYACMGGHEEIVDLLLKEDGDVLISDSYGFSPLYPACKRGNVVIIKQLLQRNGNVSFIGGIISPLFVACREGLIDVVKLLVRDKTYDPALTKSALFAACVNGHVEVVKLLIENKSDASTYDHGEPPFYAACANGNANIVKLLLENNCDCTQCNGYGQSPFYAACENNRTDVVQLLLEKNAASFSSDYIGRSPLCIACKKGHLTVVRILMEHNINLEYCDIYKRTPLFYACERGYCEIVRLLLEVNADVSNMDDDRGCTPLYVACKMNHSEIVQLLLEKKVDASKPDHKGMSPLHIACLHGYENVVRLLINHRVNLSQLDVDKNSPMYLACNMGHQNIVNVLLKSNANFTKCNKFGQSPLCAALSGNHETTVQILLTKINITSYYCETSNHDCKLNNAKRFKKPHCVIQ